MKGILLDEHGDFLLAGERILTGDADPQTIENILRANRGEFKEAPLVGGEVTGMLNGRPDPMWCAAVTKQIRSVGLDVSRVTMTDQLIEVIR